MTEQIYFQTRGSEPEEHKDYFETISDIADWIGFALIGTRYGIDGKPINASTIHVLQIKEKFGTPRVYCTLASIHEDEEAALKDAKHYRFVYETAVRLFPQYEKAIREGMDYPQYLFQTNGELSTYIQDQMKWTTEARMHGVIDSFHYSEKLALVQAEQVFLKKVCNFT